MRISGRRLLTRASSRLCAPAITPVQQASLLTAFWRDAETRRDAPLICDEPAATLLNTLLAEETRRAWVSSSITPECHEILATRTALLDSWIKSWPASPGRQLVLLGAGMDTRAYRLSCLGASATTIFEVDDAALLGAKRAALAAADHSPLVTVVDVGADAADAQAVGLALASAGLDPALPTMWILEGLLEYLPPSAHQPLFHMASERGGAAGSRLAMQVLEPSWAERVVQLGAKEVGAKELPYAKLDDCEVTARAVRAAGWDTVRIVRREGFWARYGRETHEGFTMLFAGDLRSVYDVT